MKAVAWRLALGAAALAGCLSALFAQTDGLRVLTSARVPVVRAAHRPAFEAPMLTSDGRLVGHLPAAGALRVVEITYENCSTLCALQGEALTAAFRALRDDVDGGRLQFVSLSVDPRDCPAGIARRVRRLSAGRTGWDGACVADAQALALLGRRVGVVAIPDDRRDYRHTTGVFLVDGAGRVIAYQPSLDKQVLVLAIQGALPARAPAAPHG